MNKNDILNGLSAHLRIPKARVDKLVSSAPYKYKHYRVPKRTGGMRDIYQPTAALKEAQRWVVENVLSQLPISNSAFAYMPGKSIRDNANVHLRSNYFARYDFVDFFHSIHGDVISKFLRKSAKKGLISLNPEAIDLVVRIVCRKSRDSVLLSDLSLTIGAPSSPFISNVMLFNLDRDMERLADSVGGRYSRYADDIFVSSRSIIAIQKICESIPRSVMKAAPYLSINTTKTRKMSRRYRINICGVIITSNRKLSVGRDMKRWIRGAIYRAISGQLGEDELNRMKGYIAYVDSIEDGYLETIREKYRHHPGWVYINM